MNVDEILNMPQVVNKTVVDDDIRNRMEHTVTFYTSITPEVWETYLALHDYFGYPPDVYAGSLYVDGDKGIYTHFKAAVE